MREIPATRLGKGFSAAAIFSAEKTEQTWMVRHKAPANSASQRSAEEYFWKYRTWLAASQVLSRLRTSVAVGVRRCRWQPLPLLPSGSTRRVDARCHHGATSRCRWHRRCGDAVDVGSIVPAQMASAAWRYRGAGIDGVGDVVASPAKALSKSTASFPDGQGHRQTRRGIAL